MLSPLLLPLACTTQFKLLNKSEMLGQKTWIFFSAFSKFLADSSAKQFCQHIVLSITVLGLRPHGFSFACVSTDIL